MASLTKRQKQILDYITEYIDENGYSPTFEEIRRHFRLSALSTVHQHIEALAAKGYLSKSEHSARGIEIQENGGMISIQLKGLITAGQPIEAIEIKESIAIPKTKVQNYDKVYALRVRGDSMIEENIFNNDIVLVRHQKTAENGEKVIALLNNNEATLKKYFKEKSQIRLQPANKKYNSILLKNEDEIEIQGIVIDVIKNINDLHLKDHLIEKKIVRAKSLPLNKIILGDAIKELKKIPDESCDIIIADPPYNIGKDFGNNLDKRELHDYVAWCKEWIDESIRVMKSTGTMFIYGFSEILAYLSVEIQINKRWLIWHYTNKNVASLNFWQRGHEAIICVWKNKPIFNRDSIREPYTEGFLNGAAGKVRKGTAGRFSSSGKETIYKAHKGGALPRDVIKIPALAGGAGMNERWFICKTCNEVYEPRELKKHIKHKIIKHPTQKPLNISRKLILSAMPKEGGVVLVPFVGTGSECVAAKELGQSYIGFEVNPTYIKIANKYLENTKHSPKLL